MTTSERSAASRVICDRVLRSHEFMAARNIGCYLPTSDEVQVARIIQRAWRAQKRVLVPVTDSHGVMNFCEIGADTLQTRNDFNIWEPSSGLLVDARNLDIVITPVVAYDDENNRIGMGGGYYDRCFRFLRNRRKWLSPKLIGVAFECQKAKNIAPNSWDIPLYKVVSEGC